MQSDAWVMHRRCGADAPVNRSMRRKPRWRSRLGRRGIGAVVGARKKRWSSVLPAVLRGFDPKAQRGAALFAKMAGKAGKRILEFSKCATPGRNARTRGGRARKGKVRRRRAALACPQQTTVQKTGFHTRSLRRCQRRTTGPGGRPRRKARLRARWRIGAASTKVSIPPLD